MHFVTILISKLIKTAEVLTVDVLVIIRNKSHNKWHASKIITNTHVSLPPLLHC